MRSPINVALLVALTVSSILTPGLASPVRGQELITPDSEYVKAMVRPAVEYLRTKHKKRTDYGHKALVGLAIFNAGVRLGKSRREITSDPVMVEILDEVAKTVIDITPESEHTVYEACVAGLLLAEVDEAKYAQHIQHVLDFLYTRQKEHGGWTYKGEPLGDTSQNQYASLFLWLAKEKKFPVKASAVENAIKFIIATQHPTGGFIYKSSPDRPGFGRPTQSLTAAGLGALYLLGDAFGLHGGEDVTKKRKPGMELLPPSVSLVEPESEEDKAKQRQRGPVRQIAGFGNAKARGDAWFAQNFVINPENWTYYYLYGFERYSSFKERAEKVDPEAPQWYVDGAKFLKSQQNADGSWDSKNAAVPSVDNSTCFAILFLVRSTKLIIPSYMDIVEGGGNGLPEQGELKMQNGRLVNQTYRQDFDSVLALIETGKDTDWAAFENRFDSLILASQKGSRAQQLATLRKLVSNENAVARKVAVKSIGKVRDFENIKFLIFALSDPEPEIAKLANEGLRFVSRKFDAPKLSAKPNKQEIDSIVKFWSDWYLEVVPDGELLEVQ